MVKMMFIRRGFLPRCLRSFPQKNVTKRQISVSFWFILSLFLLLSPVKFVQAEEDFHLYNVVIPVIDESPEARNDAFVKGLNEVFIRLSGDSTIATNLTLPGITGYVQQYSYQPVTPDRVNNQGANKSPDNSAGNSPEEGDKFLLTVQYNGTRIINYLRDHGFPVWGEHRAVLVVWVAVRDGRHEYVLKKNDQSLIKTAIQKNLIRRGIPLRWPDYDSQDKKILGFTDIMGGFRDPLEKASIRYARGPIASISLNWNGSNWRSDWTLLFKNSEYNWSYSGANYNQLIQQSIDRMVDTMGRVYAVKELASGESATVLYMDVGDIHNVSRYKRASEYLSNIQAVKQVRVKRVDGKSVEFELTLRSDQADFLSLLKNDGELIEVKKIKVRPIAGPKQPDTTIPVSVNPDITAGQAVPPTSAPVNPPSVLLPRNGSSDTTAKHNNRTTTMPENTVVAGSLQKNAKKNTIYYFRLAK